MFCCLFTEQQEHKAVKGKKTPSPHPSINVYKRENLAVFNSQTLGIIEKHNTNT